MQCYRYDDYNGYSKSSSSAAFAFLSFFRSSSPAPSPVSSPHTHTGHVIGAPTVPAAAVGYDGWTWHGAVQVLHLAVSALLFAVIMNVAAGMRTSPRIFL